MPQIQKDGVHVRSIYITIHKKFNMKTIKIIPLFLIINLLFCNMNAQKSEPVWVPSKSPEFPGGDEARKKFFKDNIIYPKEAKEKGIEMDVLVYLIIEEDGSFSEVELVPFFKDKYKYGLGEEALRVVNLMPKWIPGEENGKIVRTQWMISVYFALDGSTYVYGPDIDGKAKEQAEKPVKDYRYFSTDKTDDSSDGIYKAYRLKLYQDGRYAIYLSETRSHFIYYDEETNKSINSDMIMPDIKISEGNYIEIEQTLFLTDTAKQIKLEYQSGFDTIIRLPLFPNEIKKCLFPVQTLPLLEKMLFRGE